MSELIDCITTPAGVRKLTLQQLEALAQECREIIIQATSQAGGHLASSLGTVELTLALFHVFHADQDKFIWDVGHQAYTHKILTNRHKLLAKIGTREGVGKFLRREESPYDIFGAGHASTSISAGLGVAVATRLAQQSGKTIAIIGDGGLTGGLAYEAMNHTGHLDEDLVVILNDNDMSIDPNVGALSKTFNLIQSSRAYNKIRSEITKLEQHGKLSSFFVNSAKRIDQSFMEFLSPASWFEKLGFRYFGPVDGHDLKKVIENLQNIRRIKGPVLLHLNTIKGKGYPHAEKDSLTYHGVTPFEPDSGKFSPKSNSTGQAYTKVWSAVFEHFMREDTKICGVSAAMIGSTGLKSLQKAFPERIFDTGIAEGHAVTFSGGLATQGYKPFVAIYSTFLQRALDHIIHDVALQNLPVRFVLDRAGFVGADGATHHGMFDLVYLRMIPNMTLMVPRDGKLLARMLLTARSHQSGPIALRFPRGETLCHYTAEELADTAQLEPIPLGTAETLESGTQLLFIAVGVAVDLALEASETLEKMSISCGVIDARFVKPLDERLIIGEVRRYAAVITLEEGVVSGGFGSAILELFAAHQLLIPVRTIGIPDEFIEYGTVGEQRADAGLHPDNITESALSLLQQATPKSAQEAEVARA